MLIPFRRFADAKGHSRRYFHSSTQWFDTFCREESRRLSHATATPRAYRATDGARIASRYSINPPGRFVGPHGGSGTAVGPHRPARLFNITIRRSFHAPRRNIV